MVNTSKILTVSYGTFSCTLEGFDDSFDTMKAIAEYFRDLAADDRYFGAEPPTPDADMLARIAEREIARRVEAHEEQGKIVLRAGDAPAALAAVAATDMAAEDQHAEAEAPSVEETQPEEVVDAADDVAADTSENDVEELAPAISAALQDEDVSSEEAPVEEATTEEVGVPAETTEVASEVAPADEDVAEEVIEAAEEAIEEEPVATVEDTPAADDLLEAPVVTAQTESFVAEEQAAETVVEEMPEEPIAQEPAETVEATSDASVEETVTEEIHSEDDTPVEQFIDEELSEAVEEEVAVEAAAENFAAEIAVEDEAAIDDYVETAEAFFENSPEPDVADHYETEMVDAPVSVPDADSVADRLSRIRSVVSQKDQPYEQDDYSEDEHAQDFLNEAAAELDAALAEDDAAEIEQAEPVETGMSDVELLASLASKRAQQIDEEEASSKAAATATDDEDDFEDTLSQLLADSITDGETSEAEDLTEIETQNEVAEEMVDFDLPDAMVEDETVEISDDAENVSEMSDDDETRAQLNARVLKVTREDFDAAIADGLSEDDQAEDFVETAWADDDTDGDADVEMADAEQVLSPEQEEDLQRALAEVEADLAVADEEEMHAPDVAEENSDDASEEIEHHAASRDGRHKLESAGDQSDIERIFDEADSQLEKPESNQRRSAIQHLRAAVAATRAEKKAGADLQKNVDDTPYRSDLASVVRPRRPSASEGTRSQRPVEGRPAPLKLVAEQRVDMERAPIRPRRVSATELVEDTKNTGVESGSNFSDYARQMGATQLPDLLEAAAAYISDVEGREQFSRPMLMHKIQEVEKENFAREDGLRSFGQLLREGKIQKIKGGRFTVTEETDFRDETRHAG
ncbi:hypothetical protein [uncultured Roseovarius sp.]|uniref:hypothetical protein n=1 Tax=uncultured Roseovarius sp. TaxID=293344 RepID=UPI002625AFB0|nr:hypothetical protein [uncultured Roseovarius sp.]